MLESLIAQYGYVAIFIGTFVEGETVLVLGGFAAHRGYLSLLGVMIAAFLGSGLGDYLFFYLGRRHSQWLLARFPQWQSRIAKVHGWLDRMQLPVLLGFRFFYGFRILTPVVIGMSDIRAGRFILLQTLGAAVWASAVGVGGYFFGSLLETLLGDLKRFERHVLVALAAAGLLIWIYHRWRRKRDPAAL